MNHITELEVGEKTYPVRYEKGMKRTSSVRVKDGVIVLRISRFAFGKHREEMVEKFLKWARKKLEKASEGGFVEPVYEDGGHVCTHNKIYEISVRREDRKNSSVNLRDEYLIEIILPLEGGDVRALAERIIIKDQLSYLEEVVDELNDLYFRERYEAVRFKRMNSRFGSCSTKRNINIAYRLLFAPREVFRYVCIHELAHLKQMNHSKKFWALVAEAEPNYKEHEKWLKGSGFLLG